MDPDNGRVMVNGETATYSCNTGFELQGAVTMTCAANRMWSEEPPLCRRELPHN